jgi:hypothetical protein
MVAAINNPATVQQILSACADSISKHPQVQKVTRQLMQCRTAANGYHLYKCTDASCNHKVYRYHSCHNRHCPCCGALKKDAWIEARKLELVPVKYYHVVFTLPHPLNSMVLGNRAVLYKLLFDASAQTILQFAADKQYMGAKPGVVSVLHTWGQQLSFHPHIHAIVSGGGIVQQQGCAQWVEGKQNEWCFLFPVKAMSVVYRGKFLQALQAMLAAGKVKPPPNTNTQNLMNQMYQTNWVVYAKQPFGGPEQVIEYLGRYTHKVAISNHRILAYDQQTHSVTFQWKDYADGGAQKVMTIADKEFVRRFEQHVLPQGFTRIRSYGYLANRGRKERISTIVKLLELPPHPPPVQVPLAVRLLERLGIDPHQCPCCHKASLQLIDIVYGTAKRKAPA